MSTIRTCTSPVGEEGEALRGEIALWGKACGAALREYGKWISDSVLPSFPEGQDDGVGAAVGKDVYQELISER